MRTLLLVVAAAAGCWRAPTPSEPAPTSKPLTGPAYLFPGEAFEFELTLSNVPIGHVHVAIGEPGSTDDGRRAIVIKSRGESDSVWAILGSMRWELTTTLDLADATAIDELEESWIDAVGEEPKHLRWERGATGQDRNIHAAGAALRGWQSRQGDATQFKTVIDHVHIDVSLHHAGRDFIHMTPAVAYTGIARGKYPITIWFSDDIARAPLRLRSQSRWGEIGLDLVAYTAPKERARD